MKKTALAITIVLSLSLMGCGTNDNSDITYESVETNQSIATTEINESEKPTIETTSLESSEIILDEDTYLSQLYSDINWQLEPRDSINEISIEDGNLYISITRIHNNRTLDRFSSVADAVLAFEDGYVFWDSITIDFGSQGYITKGKEEIVTDDTGNHFTISQDDIIQ